MKTIKSLPCRISHWDRMNGSRLRIQSESTRSPVIFEGNTGTCATNGQRWIRLVTATC